MSTLTYTKKRTEWVTKDELIEILKDDLKNTRIQRNVYEQELIAARKELSKVKTELEGLEDYINNRK